ncbi:hypothetical protein CN327_21850 [Bacillus cereus]|nr:hypothetical protein CON53_29560 [Bacillus cereus]PES77726.1 hypothetical protein CN509_14445 [Bacillus cereus]PET05794.1 hypothetical protein CN505_11920 [Bacillus cereus]PFF30860.1 hypothetical protein CN327_21850 [Bacillus cereus]PFH81361.1 hypothetical protein COI81_29345 [Bacillus cereus]
MQFFIHSYYSTVLGFFFVTGLAQKLYKILHALSVVFFQNAGDTPTRKTEIQRNSIFRLTLILMLLSLLSSLN